MLHTQVKVLVGRNKGKWGKVTCEQGNDVCVSFGGMVSTKDGDYYPDSYWVRKENIEVTQESK